MKIIIAGSRVLPSRCGPKWEYHVLRAYQMSGFQATEIVSGGAKGADLAGEWLAKDRGWPITQFLPDWNGLGLAAGPIRNKQMAEYADALIALWDGVSKGTESMIKFAQEKGLKVYVYKL